MPLRTLMEADSIFDQQPWPTVQHEREARAFLDQVASEVETRVSDSLVERQSANRERAETGVAALNSVVVKARELRNAITDGLMAPEDAVDELDRLRAEAQRGSNLIVEGLQAQEIVRAGLGDVWKVDHDLRSRYNLKIDFPW
jgi:hypothetical protein